MATLCLSSWGPTECRQYKVQACRHLRVCNQTLVTTFIIRFLTKWLGVIYDIHSVRTNPEVKIGEVGASLEAVQKSVILVQKADDCI